jgi:glycosyltransferase involved in cell wall biosynthesis
VTVRVAQVNCVLDPQRCDPEALLTAWHTLPAVAEATAGAGAEVVVVQASHAGAKFTRRGVRYHFIPVGAAGSLAPWRLRHAVQEVAPDIVHLQGLDFPLHARLLSTLMPPVLVQDHASNAAQRGLGRLRRWGYAHAAAALFTAEAQAEAFRAARQLPAKASIFVVPESSSGFEPGDPAEARLQTGVGGNPAILRIGRLDSNKDPLTAIEAFRLARQRLPRAELWLVYGTDALLPMLERRLAEEPALARHVHLLGRVPHAQVEQLCRACDLLLATSHREGSGYALIEALACGLPPVVSDIAPFRALVGNLSVSRFAPPGDALAFAKGLISLARQSGAQRRAAVRGHFDVHLAFSAVGRRLVDIYGAVIARSAQ